MKKITYNKIFDLVKNTLGENYYLIRMDARYGNKVAIATGMISGTMGTAYTEYMTLKEMYSYMQGYIAAKNNQLPTKKEAL